MVYRSTVGGLSVDCLIIKVKSLDRQCQLYNLYALCLDHVRKFSRYQAIHLSEILQSSSIRVVCNKACVYSRYAETSIHSIYLFIYFVIRPRAGDNTIGL